MIPLSNILFDLVNYLPPHIQYAWHAYTNRYLNGKFLILSFDCDTNADAIASLQLTDWLKQHKIPAIFAVPGKRLDADRQIYQQIARKGFTFINHGYEEHTVFSKEQNCFVSITNYSEMTDVQVQNDINKAHDVIVEQLGVEPLGFRAPHFGMCQKDRILSNIYSTIFSLNYKFCSSTTPAKGIILGSKYLAYKNIYEFPVSGTFDIPSFVLDSWSFFTAPNKVMSPTDYLLQTKKMADYHSVRQSSHIFNLYVDPAQIINRSEFFESMEYIINKGYIPTDYLSLI